MLLAITLLITGRRPAIVAHYMPWYQSKPHSGSWGWHWTMNHFNPDRAKDGRQEAASRYRPLIGLYDSGDKRAVDCQMQLMKMAGIDGIFIDWYGAIDALDYAINRRNADLAAQEAARAGLKVAFVFEDATLKELISLRKIKPEEAMSAGKADVRWLDDHYFGQPWYLKLDGKPVLLDFGPMFFTKPGDWPSLFDGLKHPPAFFSLQNAVKGAVGGFGWMEPQVGDARSRENLRGFYRRAKAWPSAIGVAFPRFEDIYKEAGVGPGYGEIEDRGGTTYRDSLDLAIKSGVPIIQIGTWNDWGEGTQIEPSVEFGYRDLEVTQATRRRLDPSFKYTPADLRRPIEKYLSR